MLNCYKIHKRVERYRQTERKRGGEGEKLSLQIFVPMFFVLPFSMARLFSFSCSSYSGIASFKIYHVCLGVCVCAFGIGDVNFRFGIVSIEIVARPRLVRIKL